MNTLIKAFHSLVFTLLLVSGCTTQPAQEQKAKSSLTQKSVAYQAVLGKSLRDTAVVRFISDNNCSSAGEYQLCQEAGIALWSDSSQLVSMVYLYSGHGEEFKRYRGELPFGLTFYDPMWLVQERLRNLDLGGDDTAQDASLAGLPDEVGSPDHLHYWASYKRFGLIVIYDVPFADEDAYIFTVVIQI